MHICHSVIQEINFLVSNMSGFEDSEYDEAITTAVADISFEDHIKSGMGRHNQYRQSVQLNTDFTPVRDSSPTMGTNPHSGMTSPAPSSENGGRRSSVRRSSINGAPSDELLSTTAARLNDKAALDDKYRARSPSYLHVQELPQNSHLLSTTVARVFEQNALEEQKNRKSSPQRGFKIAHEDFQVSNSLLRPTESRRAELRAIEEAKLPPSPSFKVPPPDFQPPSRLLKMTKEREADRIALEEKKNGPKRVSSGKKVSKDYTPGAHLVKPTQAFICAQNGWEKEKEDKRNAKDIWWEERRPAEKARSRPNTPSKLRSPTKAFLNAKRDKAPISQSIFASPEEAIAYNPPATLPPPPALPESSHLLKPTRAVEMGKIDAELPPEFLPKPPSLDLATRKSFSKSVDSKLYETTTAYEAGKFGADLHQTEDNGPKEKVHSPSERLLRLNTNCAHHVREKAEKVVNPREDGWNPYVVKERNYPCPSNRKRSGLHKHVSQERSNASLSMMSVGYDDGTLPSPTASGDDDDYGNSGAGLPVDDDVERSSGPESSASKRRSGAAETTAVRRSTSGVAPKPTGSAIKKPVASSSSSAASSASKPKPKAVVAAEVVKKAINSIKEHTKAANPKPSPIKKGSSVTASPARSVPTSPSAPQSSVVASPAPSLAGNDLATKIAAAEQLARGIIPATPSNQPEEAAPSVPIAEEPTVAVETTEKTEGSSEN